MFLFFLSYFIDCDVMWFLSCDNCTYCSCFGQNRLRNALNLNIIDSKFTAVVRRLDIAAQQIYKLFFTTCLFVQVSCNILIFFQLHANVSELCENIGSIVPQGSVSEFPVVSHTLSFPRFHWRNNRSVYHLIRYNVGLL